MSLNHLLTRTDPVSTRIKMGAEEIASKKYFLRSATGADTVLFDGSLTNAKYSTNFETDGLLITASNTDFPTLPGVSSSWSVTSQGEVGQFSMRLNLNKANAQTAIVLDLTFDATILPTLFADPSDANGDAGIALLSGGDNFRKVVVALEASRTMRVNFSGLTSAAGQYDINIYASFRRTVV